MNQHIRKSHRLQHYDYGSYGYYYVTICTLNHMHVLCNITYEKGISNSNVTMTDIGKKVTECFYNIETLNDNVKIDKFIVMPHHIHAIVIIMNTADIEFSDKTYSFEIWERRGRRSLQGLLKDFKSVTTRFYNKTQKTDTSLWQKSFYDEIIRTQEHYNNVCQYIDNNITKWASEHTTFP